MINIRLYALAVVIAGIIFVVGLQLGLNTTTQITLKDCRDQAIDHALEDPYVDHVLDSIAEARADSIVQRRMKDLYPN